MELKTVALLAFLNTSIQAAQGQTSNRSLCTCQTNGVIDIPLTESGCLANTGFFESPCNLPSDGAKKEFKAWCTEGGQGSACNGTTSAPV
ncbi:hypothetical protein K438DRAFT_1965218 [Mycena galopus ATCC 62051]|nr:hypothetical protein K438DRAFT_1965218 [Mycena galopus ATCC 62051]